MLTRADEHDSLARFIGTFHWDVAGTFLWHVSVAAFWDLFQVDCLKLKDMKDTYPAPASSSSPYLPVPSKSPLSDDIAGPLYTGAREVANVTFK
jgi:hypothetical protein